MQVINTEIPDVKIIEPKVFGDERGFFLETFRNDWFKQHCADVEFVQDNHSKSSRGILRGLHYQLTCGVPYLPALITLMGIGTCTLHSSNLIR